MTAVARIGDIVTGYCDGGGHDKQREFTGVWVSGSDILFADDIGVIRIGDTGVTDCDHTFIAATGSDIMDENGAGIHRVGDIVLVSEGGVGVTITGSDTTESE